MDGGGGLSLGIKRPECEADKSSKFSAKSKNEWCYGFSSHMSTWHGTQSRRGKRYI